MKCIVTGRRHQVLGKKAGETVYLDDAHAARLIRAGHVEAAPESPPEVKPKRPRRPAPKPIEPEVTQPGRASDAGEPDGRTTDSRTDPSPS